MPGSRDLQQVVHIHGLPHLEYGNSIWCPYKIRDIEAIEAVQRRATRQLPGMKDLSYEERLRKLKLPTLVYRRARGDTYRGVQTCHWDLQIGKPILQAKHGFHHKRSQLQTKEREGKAGSEEVLFPTQSGQPLEPTPTRRSKCTYPELPEEQT